MALNLQDGRAYRDGAGDRVQVRLAYADSDLPFERTNGDPTRYMADGRYIDDELGLATAVYDLVEEWPNENGAGA